jgi:hypothetical protein
LISISTNRIKIISDLFSANYLSSSFSTTFCKSVNFLSCLFRCALSSLPLFLCQVSLSRSQWLFWFCLLCSVARGTHPRAKQGKRRAEDANQWPSIREPEACKAKWSVDPQHFVPFQSKRNYVLLCTVINVKHIKTWFPVISNVKPWICCQLEMQENPCVVYA